MKTLRHMYPIALPGERLIFHRHRDHSHSRNHGPNYKDRPKGGSATIKTSSQEIKVVRRVLDANDMMAAQNRKLFQEKKRFRS